MQEHDRVDPRRRAAAQDRAVLTAHAVRGARGRAPGGRQLPARAHVERDPRRCSASSRCSGRSTPRQLDKVQQRFDAVAKEYAALMTTRHRALQRPLDKIEHAAPRGARRSLDAEIPPLALPRAERGRGASVASVPRRDAGDGARRRTARAHARAGRASRSGCAFRVPRPVAGRARPATVGDLVVGALDDVAAAAQAADGADGRHVRVGRRARRRRRARSQPIAPVLPARARARGRRRTGSSRRTTFRALGIATAPFRAVDDRASTSTPRSARSGCPRC